MNVDWGSSPGSARAADLDLSSYNTCGTHVPALAAAVAAARAGSVLELGVGMYSTPLLHAMCAAVRRPLVSLDDNLEWIAKVETLRSPGHRIGLVPSWNECLDWLPQYGNWAVIFVDHWTETGQERLRSIDVMADRCELMVVHDAEHSVYGDFLNQRFLDRAAYTRMLPWTAIVSNVRDVSEFAEGL